MTPKEKMTKAVSEGFDWLFARIAMVLGETDRPSYETRSAATEARRAAWLAQDAFRRFEAVARGEDAEEIDLRQASLPYASPSQAELDARDARDAKAGREKAAARDFGDIPDAPDAPDAELEQVEGELAVELDRVLGDDRELITASVYADVDHYASIEVGGGSPVDATAWSITRDAPLVIGALRQLDDGAGPDAVRAILCGWAETVRDIAARTINEEVEELRCEAGDAQAETPACTCGAVEDDLGVVVHADDCGLCGVSNDPVEDDGEAKLKEWVGDPDDQVEADIVQTEVAIGAELTRCGADGVETRCARNGTGSLEAGLTGSTWSSIMLAYDVEVALKALSDDCGEAAVRTKLLTVPGALYREAEATPNPEPEDELAPGLSHYEALRLLRGQMVSIRWPGSADGTGEKLAMVERVNPTGATVAVHVARTTPKGEYTGELGKELRWVGCRDVLRVEEAVGRELVVPEAPPPPTDEDLPGRPVGEPAKRRKPKAKKAELSGPPDYYDGKRTGD